MPDAPPPERKGLPVGLSGLRTDLRTNPGLALGGLKPVGRQRIVDVDGQPGIFVPIATRPGTPLDPDSERNLAEVNQVLRDALADAQQQNADLQGRLEAVLRPATSPEDFATAVQRSVDELQQKLASMHNPVSNFAVREFRLEANVLVDVTPLGTIEYRFARPEDGAGAAALSRVAMTLVPVPKASAAGTWLPALFQPEAGVEALEGLTPAQRETLEANHIASVGEFLAVGTRARTAARLTALLGVDRARLAAWLAQAELLTLRGVDGAAAVTLLAAGVTGLDVLAELAPADVAKRYNAAAAAAGRPPVDEARAAEWVRAARTWAGRQDEPA